MCNCKTDSCQENTKVQLEDTEINENLYDCTLQKQYINLKFQDKFKTYTYRL